MDKATSHDCGRCYGQTKATTCRLFGYDGDTHELWLCDAHDAAFLRDIHGWVRCATPVAPAADQDDAAFGGIVRASYVHIPTSRTPQQTLRIVPDPAPATKPKAPPRPVPVLPEGYAEWKVTEHAYDRHLERDIRPEDIFWCACEPEIRWPSNTKPGTWIHERGSIHLVVDPSTKQILTVAITGKAKEQANG